MGKDQPFRPVRDLQNGRFLPSVGDFVQEMMYGNCQRPFYIYLQTFLPAFLEAAFMLRFFDLNDIMRKTAETAAGGKARKPRGGKHGRTKRGKELPRTKQDRLYRSGLKTLLMLTAPLEKLGFALLIYSVIDNFYYKWLMYIEDADACLNPGFFGPLIRRGDLAQWPSNPAGFAAPLPTLIFNGGNWSTTAFGCGVPTGRYKVVFAATITNPDVNAQGFRLNIETQGSVGTGLFHGEVVQIGAQQTADLIVTADIFFPLLIGNTIAWTITGPLIPAGVECTKADIVVQRRQGLIDT